MLTTASPCMPFSCHAHAGMCTCQHSSRLCLRSDSEGMFLDIVAASRSWHRGMDPSLQVLFDPHCSFLPSVSSANPGKRIRFVRSAVLDTYRDQFEPYIAFGCDMRSHYGGTLFRFPLRSPSLAEQSRISKQVGEPQRGFLAFLDPVDCPSPAQLQVISII